MGFNESVICFILFLFFYSFFYFLRFLGKRGIKEDIIDFNPRNITADNRDSVEKLLKKNRESFEPEVKYRKKKFSFLIFIFFLRLLKELQPLRHL
jgi:hypothetical protein